MLFPLYGRRDGVRLALGLHPLEVARVQLETELRLFTAYAGHTSYIGEIGLDFSPDGRASRALQERTLNRLLGITGVSDKVLSVHSRRASKEVIALLVATGASRVIMHWFSGPIRDVEAALDAGFYFSFNPRMLSSKSGRATIAAVPHDRALFESDGPYARIRGRAAEPPDVLAVADFLAREWEASRDETLAAVESNLRQLCGTLPNVEGGPPVDTRE
jgi:TatD DNase family protein